MSVGNERVGVNGQVGVPPPERHYENDPLVKTRRSRRKERNAGVRDPRHRLESVFVTDASVVHEVSECPGDGAQEQADPACGEPADSPARDHKHGET